MLKNKKVNDWLEMLSRKMSQNDIDELYKALIAYSIGYDMVDEKEEKQLDRILEDIYYGDDYIISFINEEIYNEAKLRLD